MKKTFLSLALALSFLVNAQTVSPSGIYQYKRTVSSGEMAAIGSVPKTILSAPGAGKRIQVIQGTITMCRSGGTTNGYTFSTGDAKLTLLCDGITVAKWANSGGTTILVSNTCQPSDPLSGEYYNIDYTNKALTFTTEDGTNPTAGDNTITISFLYTITQ